MRAHAGFGAVAALGVLLGGCDGSDAPDDVVRPERAPRIATVVPVDQALENAHVPTLDPGTMNDAEIRLALGAGPLCMVQYTTVGGPVLAVSQDPGAAGAGLVKFNGHLVRLEPAAAEPGWSRLQAGPVRLSVAPPLPEGVAPLQDAELVFEVGEELRVGYRGFLDCAGAPPTHLSRR
ncbi:hypothetical protein DFH01_06425 [Falsiroseomonas bella]|uniref:DUF6692 domain-containing protein n=1 Tax=Falsiroseomonas bella TaxID=2184016 RepID=A0A317FN38_9PROT|nr:DUF6692 family protein [Falsiroseomonas bella]PWS38878.1 hypothetical protein DFH01_06425 [Falsiroseomonas bella]